MQIFRLSYVYHVFIVSSFFPTHSFFSICPLSILFLYCMSQAFSFSFSVYTTIYFPLRSLSSFISLYFDSEIFFSFCDYSLVHISCSLPTPTSCLKISASIYSRPSVCHFYLPFSFCLIHSLRAEIFLCDSVFLQTLQGDEGQCSV